ncbi:MAG: PAS domain S-box protein [Mucilaginibacter sp.]
MNNRSKSSNTGVNTGSKNVGGNVEAAANVFDSCPLPIIGIDTDGAITYVNDLAVSALGLDRESAVGLLFTGLFEEETPHKPSTACILGGQPVKDKEFTINVHGERRWVLVSTSIFREKEGDIKTYVFIQDITRLKKRDNLFSYLNQAASVLARARDTPTALRQIARLIVPSFADWFTIDLIAGDELELILLKHDDPEKIEWAYQYRKNYPPDLNGNSGQAIVLKTGQPAFIPFVTEQMIDPIITDPVQRDEVRKIGLHSVIMAPMWGDEKITGIVNFISSQPGRHFDEEDLHFALNFANLIGLALQNTRLNEEASREIVRRKDGEQRFKFLLDAIPHKMWTSGPDGRATYYNKQWHDYTGVQGFENLRDKIWSLIHPDDLAESARRWPEAVETGAGMEIEHRLQRFDGSYRWHLSRFSAQKNELGEVTLWVGTSTDIHDQKSYEIELATANEEIVATNEELYAANEELESANEEQMATNEELMHAQERLHGALHALEAGKRRFQNFLDSIPQIAWSSSAAGEVEYYNQRWYDYTGLTFEQTKSWGWKQVIHPDDLRHNLDRLSEIIQSRQPGEFEIREKGIDGVYRWHLVRMSPLFNQAGELEEWVGTATDIDALKKLQQQKDDFISIASHELKTPLTALKTSVQLLHRMKNNISAEKFPGLIDQANRSVHKMTTLIDELLNVNRVSEPQLTLQKQWFVLSELVNACSNPVALTGLHDIVIMGDKTLQVYADDSAIDRVIVNLINNAVKYAPESREIVITIASAGTAAKLSVTDRGPGIPQEQLPLIFNRYYQAGKQHYRNPGLGLGLYICSEIIKRHGGEIGVESELAKGSTFWFTLPLPE